MYILSLVLSSAAWGADLVVPADYADITTALAAAQANDRIVLEGGKFSESIVVDQGFKVQLSSDPIVTTLSGASPVVISVA
ncbi:MAG: hypothetical protein HN348_22580, partial [Proteobacteria bacterium]|nr:hypothetical protein [Pseudomonadota bacterium]